jgi:AdoMet-dependent heme synthase
LITELLNKYVASGSLLLAHIDLTHRCPLSCKHCYLGGNAKTAELSLAQHIELLDQLASLGAFGVLYSGGEIFLRQDLEDIISHAKNKGFIVNLKTSGFLCTPARLDTVVKLGVAGVDVSLYSHLPETHDKVTGLDDSFRRAVDTLLALDGRVKAQAVVTLLKGFEEDPRPVETGLKALGISKILFNELAEISCDGYPLDSLWISEQAIENHWRHISGGNFTPRKPAQGEPPCRAGLTNVHISPSGDVRPCVEFPSPVGNIADQPLEKIWREAPLFQELRQLSYDRLPGCQTCEDRNLCSFCPARSLKETGAIDLPAPTVCRRTGVWKKIIKK